jgi:hypothetical protein
MNTYAIALKLRYIHLDGSNLGLITALNAAIGEDMFYERQIEQLRQNKKEDLFLTIWMLFL